MTVSGSDEYEVKKLIEKSNFFETVFTFLGKKGEKLIEKKLLEPSSSFYGNVRETFGFFSWPGSNAEILTDWEKLTVLA